MMTYGADINRKEISDAIYFAKTCIREIGKRDTHHHNLDIIEGLANFALDYHHFPTWKPIDSAPKDRMIQIGCRVKSGGWQKKVTKFRRLFGWRYKTHMDNPPTHWSEVQPPPRWDKDGN